MRQLRKTLRLHLEARLSLRECARVLGISKTTVGAVLTMARTLVRGSRGCRRQRYQGKHLAPFEA
jgi:DNA-directed RNA polymerase specialized sigma24 family protein